METLYLALLFTSVAMMSILALTFFDTQLKNILTAPIYSRAFTLMAMMTVAGILYATTIGFAGRKADRQAMVINSRISNR